MITVRILVATVIMAAVARGDLGRASTSCSGRSLPAQIVSVGIACAAACVALREDRAVDADPRGSPDPGAGGAAAATSSLSSERT